MRRRRNTPYIIGFFVVWLCFGVVGFIFGYYYSPGNEGKEPPYIVENPSVGTDRIDTEDSNLLNGEEYKERPVTSSDIVISDETKIVFRTLYERCQTINDSVMEKPLEEMIGLNESKFKEYVSISNFQGWQMVRFSGDEVVLFERKNHICPDHFLVSQEDGYIVIYKYDETGKKELIEKTAIPISVLPKMDQDKLENGILLPSRVEVNKLLEDYSG